MDETDLMIIHPHLDVTGGSEKLTLILVEELVKRDYSIVVLSRNFSQEFLRLSGRVSYEKFRQVGLDLGDKRLNRITELYVSFSEVVKKYNPRIVFAMIQEPVYLVLSKIIAPKKKTAIYIHFPFEEEVTRENIDMFIDMYRFPGFYEDMFKYVDLKLTNSNYTARVLYEHFRLESNVVYPAIPWEYYEEEIDLGEDPGPTIISVGRFVPHKRLDVLLKLFRSHIKPRVRDSKLIIVGVPDERYLDYYERLKNMALSTEDVELVDKPLTPRQLLSYYRRARVYVHLRIGEHFGMAPVEAMTQGAIPILPLKSGLAELLTHGWNGYVYGDDSELVNYIVRVLEMPRKEYLEMRRRVYRKSLYFTPERFVSDIIGYLGV